MCRARLGSDQHGGAVVHLGGLVRRRGLGSARTADRGSTSSAAPSATCRASRTYSARTGGGPVVLAPQVAQRPRGTRRAAAGATRALDVLDRAPRQQDGRGLIQGGALPVDRNEGNVAGLGRNHWTLEVMAQRRGQRLADLVDQFESPRCRRSPLRRGRPINRRPSEPPERPQRPPGRRRGRGEHPLARTRYRAWARLAISR